TGGQLSLTQPVTNRDPRHRSPLVPSQRIPAGTLAGWRVLRGNRDAESSAVASPAQVSVRGRKNPFCAPIPGMDTSTPLGRVFAAQSSGLSDTRWRDLADACGK